MRLIDADKAKEYANTIPAFRHNLGNTIDFDDLIDDCLTVDAKPVIYAHWIDDSGEGDAAVCSNCGEEFDTTEAETEWKKAFDLFKEFYKYCPNCGARMDEVPADGEPKR